MAENTTLSENGTVVGMNGSNPFTILTPLQILEIVAPHVVMIDRVVSPVWYILGLIGNPISAVIWLSRKIRKTNSSAVYFGSLAIVQTIYLVLHFVMELENAWGVNTYHRPFLCEFFNFLYITPQYLVPMLVLGFTTERYIAVCHPFVKEKYCTVTRAKIVIICMAVVSVAIGSVQNYIWNWHDGLGCVFRQGPNGDSLFPDVWTWFTEMAVFGLLPVGCLVINILVVIEIHRISDQSAAHGQNSGSSNAASTTTLLAVSFYFIFTLLPATLVYAVQTKINQGPMTPNLEEWGDDPVWKKYFIYLTIRKIVEELCLSNYAAYFIIYYSTGVYFRREFQTLIGIRKLIRKRKAMKNSRTVASDYSVINSNGNTMTETVFTDYPSD